MIVLPVHIVRRLTEIARTAGVKAGIDVVGPFDHDSVKVAEEAVRKAQEALHG